MLVEFVCKLRIAAPHQVGAAICLTMILADMRHKGYDLAGTEGRVGANL